MDTAPSNRHLIIFDGICATAMNSFFVGPFLAAFALALGATHWGNRAYFRNRFFQHAHAACGALRSRPVEAAARTDFLVRAKRAASVDSGGFPTLRSRESLCGFLVDGPGL